MGKRRYLAIIATAVGIALLSPAMASAQVPGVPPGTIPEGTVPPEVQQVIDDALAEALGALIENPPPAIDGVGEASATPGHAEASVVEIPDVVTFGKSESTKDGSKVTVLNVGGTDLLVRENDDSYSGDAAAAGDGVDQLNEALCPGGPPTTASGPKNCVLLLYSDAGTTETTTPGALTTTKNTTHSAQFRALSIHTDQAPESLTVGSTSASTTNTVVTMNSTGGVVLDRCTDIATSFLISGGGALAALLLVNPGGPLEGVKFSILQTC